MTVSFRRSLGYAPPFAAGDRGEIGGVHWRVAPGEKDGNLNDLVMLLHAPREVKVKMSVSFLLADFHYQVEDILYPPPHARGGEMFLGHIQAAVDMGWKWPHEEVEAARQTSKRRRVA